MELLNFILLIIIALLIFFLLKKEKVLGINTEEKIIMKKLRQLRTKNIEEVSIIY